jgi:hypothetical protein
LIIASIWQLRSAVSNLKQQLWTAALCKQLAGLTGKDLRCSFVYCRKKDNVNFSNHVLFLLPQQQQQQETHPHWQWQQSLAIWVECVQFAAAAGMIPAWSAGWLNEAIREQHQALIRPGKQQATGVPDGCTADGNG